ncbi:MAG: hypothetical protein IT431_07750 [Phycisphaerales bacterium]|nr:hypothetical protein [Phycisphaerales bacterium]
MTASYGAFCTDFYINLKLGLKLELSRGRDTVLSMFERLRRQYPGMTEFRKYKDELALESPTRDTPHRWVSVRTNSVRSGIVNPGAMIDAYRLHETVLEVSPYFLSISPLDVEFVEVLYGFDLAAGGNHDEIVADALLGGSPLAKLLDGRDGRTIDCQPVVGLSLSDGTEAYFEVKTRRGEGGRERSEEPISVYLTLRRAGPVDDIKQLRETLRTLTAHGEELVETRLLPVVLNPIRNSIMPGL